MSPNFKNRLKEAGPQQISPLVMDEVAVKASRWHMWRLVVTGATVLLTAAGAAGTWMAIDMKQPLGPELGVRDQVQCDVPEYDAILFLANDISRQELRFLTQRMTENQAVEMAIFVSSADAYEELKANHGNKPELWYNLPLDALPPSLRLTFASGLPERDVARVMEEAGSYRGVEEARRVDNLCRRRLPE